MLKKILIVIGVLVGLFVVTAVALPMFVDANKYRPQIEKLVEENINADLELGKLSFSLWGGLHIEIEKLVLSDKGTHGASPIFAMNDAKLEIPILSVISGRPNITLAVKNPQIHVTAGMDGKLNVAKIAKPSAAPATPPAAAGGKSSGAGAAAALPFELSFHIEDGTLVYADQKKGTSTTVKGFNFDLKKFAVNRPFEFDFNSKLDVKEMKDLTLREPLDLKGTAAVYLGSAGLDHVDLESDLDMSGLLIRFGTLLNKEENAPLKVGVKLAATDKDLRIDRGHLQIEDAAVDATGSVKNFDSPVLDLHVSSTKFVFDNWQKVLGPLKDFDMKGSANFDVAVSGPLATMNFQGKAGVDNVSLKAPGIVPRVTDVNSTLSFSNDTATLSKTSLKMGDSDLEMDGTVRSFTKPVIVFNIRSSNFDVDSLLPQKTPDQQKADEAQAKAEAAKGSQEEFDAEKAAAGPIAAMKKNPIARALDFTGNAHFAKLVVHRAPVSNLEAEITFKDLVMSLKKSSAKAFAGVANFNTSIDFRGADPVYSVGGEVNGLDVNAAITNQMPVAKDSLTGIMQAKFEISGSGLSKAKVKQNLKGKGNFKLDKGSWSGLLAMQMIGDKLKSLPANVGQKIGNVNISDKFRDLKSDFTIAGGHLNIVNMIADSEGANTAISGNGWIDFDMNCDMDVNLIIPNGDPSTPSQYKVAGGRASYPLGFNGSVLHPNPKMDKIMAIGQAYALAAAKSQGMQALKKGLGDKIDNPTVKNLLNKLPF